MQISDEQLAANQANAQKSTGPTSIAGKKKSSQNARRHGVTAQTTVMTEEDRIEHDDFCTKMIAELAPVGIMETFLASSVAEEAWRLNHSRAQCNNIVAIGHFDGTATASTPTIPKSIPPSLRPPSSGTTPEPSDCYLHTSSASIAPSRSTISAQAARVRCARVSENSSVSFKPSVKPNAPRIWTTPVSSANWLNYRVYLTNQRMTASFFRMPKSTATPTTSIASNWRKRRTRPTENT